MEPNEPDDGGGVEDTPMESSTASDSPRQDDTEQQPASKKISRDTRDTSVDMLGEDSIPGLRQDVYRVPLTNSDSSSNTSSEPNATAKSVIGGHGPAPPLDEQIAIITKAIQDPLVDGMKGYVVSNRWLTEAQEKGTAVTKSSKDIKYETQRPIDNRDLVDTSIGELVDGNGQRFVPLKPGLVLDRDIQIVPEAAWLQLIQWYGVIAEPPDIVRWCHNTSDGVIENLQYELNPPIFTLVKLAWLPEPTSKEAMAQKELPPERIVASRHEKFQDFLRRAKAAAKITKSAVRVWMTAENVVTSLKNAGGMPTPAASRSASPAPGSLQAINIGSKLILDPDTFAELPDGAVQISNARDETSNANYNGKSTLDTYGITRPGVIILEEQIGGPAGGEWITEASKMTLVKHGIKSLETLKPTPSGRSSPAPSHGIVTRGRAKKHVRNRGVVGLGNLGNTCYMNAALQSLRAVKELTYYFLEGKWKSEVNTDNPIGFGGQVAKAFAELLKEIYSQGQSSVTPRQFKQMVSRLSPSFSGYSQHDSSEFLGWLLDCLQEDLNRILKKPYTERPDSTDDMVNNMEKLRPFADKCWELYTSRNDSIINDLFTGMYRSTLQCPVCDKISYTFDPYMNILLQLPLERGLHQNVHFYPTKGRPVTVEIDIPLSLTFYGFKEYIAKKFNTDPKRLVLAEAYNGKFWKVFDDKQIISEEKPQDADYVAFYELDYVPSNYPSRTTKPRSMLDVGSETEDDDSADNSKEDSIAIPVFNRKLKGLRTSRDIVGYPFIISLKKSDLGNEDEILRAILTKLNGFTTQDFLSDDGEDLPEDEEPDLISARDVDSGSDSKIITESLPSEDEEFVDVSTAHSGEHRDAQDIEQTLYISYPAQNPEPGSKSHPKCLQRGAFIPNNVRHLFSISIFKEASETFPKGWDTLGDDNRKLRKLDDRIFKRDQKPASVNEILVGEQLKRAIVNGGSEDGSEDDLASEGVTVSRFAIEDDDEDSRVNSFTNGRQKHRKHNKPKHTYSKKDQRRQRRAQTRHRPESMDGSFSDIEDDEIDSSRKPVLLHTGEGLILEWTPESWAEIFGVADEHLIISKSEIMHPDPEAAARKAARERKTKDGVTLEDCWDELSKPEVLSESEQWRCPRCKEFRRATKTLELWSIPDILIVSLKRFSDNGRTKLNMNVDFPLDGLDMTSRVLLHNDDRSLVYDLIAVDNHFGGLGGGHYTALAQNFEDGQWYDFNDSMASPKADPASQFSNAAYVLFYRRRSLKPLGGPRCEEMFAGLDDGIIDGVSNPSSRTTSPSGEGQRLGDSSRGFSSAYQDQEAVHQAGNGGLMVTNRATTRSMARTAQEQVDEDNVLPSYEEAQEYRNDMDIDNSHAVVPWSQNTWSGFGNLRSAGQSPSDGDVDSLHNDVGSDSGREALLSGDFHRPGTPDDDNDSTMAGADSTIGLGGASTEPEIKVNWGGASDDDDTMEEDNVHEIRD